MARQPADTDTSPTLGRPRDGELDARVLDAARRSLVDLGWEGTSVRGIAQRSGVSRPAIARRWPSKAHLVLEAILGATPDMEPFADVDLDGWISAVVEGSFALYDRPEVRAAAPGLLATLRDHDDIRAALWQGFTQPAAALLSDLSAGPASDGASSDQQLDAQAAIVLAAGAAMFTALIADDPAVRERVVALLTRSITGALAGPEER